MAEVAVPAPSLVRRLVEVVWAFLPFGWIAFGGPQAHIALLHERFVERRQWLDDQRFVELLGLGQGLPGPTSTQMVVAVGTARAGPLGGLLALFLFLLPAGTIMGLAGLGVSQFLDASNRPVWLDGVQPATVALVAVAAWRLGLAVVNSRLTIALMLLGGVAAILFRQPWVFPLVLALGGLVSVVALRRSGSNLSPDAPGVPLANLGISRAAGALLLATFFVLLIGLVVSRLVFQWELFGIFESFYRMGSLIFGGGQVVLPMMLTEVVNTGLVTEEQFLDGFALMLALPGPLFSFSAYLGAVSAGVPGLLVAAVGLFLPGVLIIYAILPFWERVRRYSWVRQLLVGVNAAAIGLVLAAVFLLWEQADPGPSGAVIALLAFGAVGFFRVPAPLVIVGAGVLGWIFHVGGHVVGL
ncbi:MAG: chromate efflux transporter [Dehalococcoidia bacterium]